MNHSVLKKFAQNARTKLMKQIGTRLEYVRHQDDPYLRAHQVEKKKIEDLIQKKGKNQLIEETAYIWFNRLTALRFMDNRQYNRVRIVSPAEGETQPEVMMEIKQGRLPREIGPVSKVVSDYINGRIETQDPDREAYKTALLAWCNHLGKLMPFLFTRIDDWAALLLPQDLLSADSIIADIQNGISEEDCKSVEIIGWLYQYYISEKKDEVFAGLRKNKKITPENIPAATQLFTPHWIVQFMVENSLGRFWTNSYPSSSLHSHMEYFVETDTEEDFPKIRTPEEIKLLDPACGSGHILVYAFDVLYRIYEEEGYTIADIPALILQNNLYGIDIDDRAAALASFALCMKARNKDPNFFEKECIPHVIASSEVSADLREAGIKMSPALQSIYGYLQDAKTIGALIPVDGSDNQALLEEIEDIRSEIDGKSGRGLFESEAAEQVLQGLKQVEYLIPRYHCVITNPPYMGSKGMEQELKEFVKKHYPISKSDLFAVFMEKCIELLVKNGYMGMINQQSWMFLSSYEKLRKKIIEETEIIVMAHLGARAFETIGGEVVQTTSFVLCNGAPK